MAYSPPRTDAATAAALARSKATSAEYGRVMSTLPKEVQAVIRARTTALSAEAAAQRNRAKRAEAELAALRAERGKR
ncbi:hypothetical protein [Microbacterium sp.]|uniref:hypothetical protein n=1 Tax=Microbacterium sp. TaxID=51671 RepID=UPI002810BB47|nr:hypothetical protein [Microbacterium sp.]